MSKQSREFEHAAVALAVEVRGGARAMAASASLGDVAVAAGCERRGPIEVAPGTYVMARRGSPVVSIWHRRPSHAEIRRALLGEPATHTPRHRTAAAPRAVSATPSPKPVTASDEAGRVARIFAAIN
jgi:hypothetical protein